MSNILVCILILCVIAIITSIIIYEIYKTPHMDYIEGFANIAAGNGSYRVHEDLENPEGAAGMMDRLNTIATSFIDHLKHKYRTSDNIDYFIKPRYRERVVYGIASLEKNYRPKNLEENLPERSGGDTSYVMDKGSVFAMCLRDPKNSNKLDSKINSLTFVLMHEMTHLFTKTYGHDTLFWNNFRFILQEASDAGLYTPTNYGATGSPYCGITISYSPLFDSKLDDYRLN